MPVTSFRTYYPEAERRPRARFSQPFQSGSAGASTPEETFAADRTYRFYDLDHRGAITGACNRAFADDAEAMAHADHLLLLMNRPAVEVWQTDRLVGRREQGQPA